MKYGKIKSSGVVFAADRLEETENVSLISEKDFKAHNEKVKKANDAEDAKQKSKNATAKLKAAAEMLKAIKADDAEAFAKALSKVL